MEWAFLDLGAVEVVARDPQGVLIEYQSTYNQFAGPANRIRLVPAGTTFVAEDTKVPARHGIRGTQPPAPFERTALGKKYRLAWPNGATSIGQYARLGGWGERFAIVLENREFSVIDAESDRVVRVVMSEDTPAFRDAIVSAGRLWIEADDGVVAIPTTMLETLAPGTVEVSFERHYPMRKRDAKLACAFQWFLSKPSGRAHGRAMVEPGDVKTSSASAAKLTIYMPDLGLAQYAPLTLVDELRPWHYAGIEVPGRERVAIAKIGGSTKHTAKVTSSRAKDPTAVAKPTASKALPSRKATDELERLVAAIVANRSDDAQRAVLADLLIELGDPSAEAIAKVRAAGKATPAKLKEALGPLGLYLTKVEVQGGFPVEATLAQNAPDEEDHPRELDAACADFRLGMLHTLHMQRRASSTAYARLVGAPTATALRRVDANDKDAVDALVAAERDQLEYLENVDFARPWFSQLATKTFDRVTTVHSIVGLARLQPFVNRLIKDKSKFFQRAPRALVLDETMNRHADLLRSLGPVWAKLPLQALTVGGVTIERASPLPKITGDNARLVTVAKLVFT